METKVKLPYQLDATVYVETGDDKLSVMQAMVLGSGFLQRLAHAWEQSKKKKGDFLIAIKPELVGSGERGQSAGGGGDDNDDVLDFLVHQVQNHGFTHIVVIRNRDDTDNIPYDFGGVLQQHVVDRSWHDADFRVSLARCRTDARFFYSGCLMNSYFHTPAIANRKHVNGKKVQVYELCVLMADRFPVHFGFVDAWISHDGPNGQHPNATHTLMASANILALDWVAGEKMNVNPAFNGVIQEAMHRWGTVAIVRRGNMTPWAPWKNAGLVRAVIAGIIKKRRD
jgi:Domain of unknown function (DUF362)